MLSINAKSFEGLFNRCFEEKIPLFVSGGVGIGKSQMIYQFSKNWAEKQERKFMEWSRMSQAEKTDALDNPAHYFIFCDQRISQKDPTDLNGIFNLNKSDLLEYIPHAWCVYMTKPDAAGVIFFDEINLATPVTSGAAYQIIHDRVISDRKISDHVFICAAGNRGCDKAYTFEMPLPLQDRFNQAELVVDPELWKEWAIENGINSHFISFIAWKGDYLYRIVDKGNDKSSTPRGVARASKMVGETDIASPLAMTLISAAVGEAFAVEFQGYVKIYKKLNWDEIFAKPECVKSFEVDKLFAITGGLVEHFRKNKGEDQFEKIMDVIVCMSEDFGVITARMMRSTDNKVFAKNLKKVVEKNKSGKYLAIIKKWANILVD